MFDDVIKQSYNITDEEYDFISLESTDEDLEIFLEGLGSLESQSTFGEKRKALEVRNKYLKLYYDK